MIPRAWWLNGLIGLLIIVALPVAGHLIRGDRGGRCAWDGLEIDPIYRVRIVEDSEDAYEFCCVQCAESWLERSGRKPVAVFVTDEASGLEIEASKACYVRSTVATNPLTGNRRHVFRRVEDAMRHAEAARGRRLLGTERPFASIELLDSEDPANAE